LDAFFRGTAQRQYEKELLFSQVVELMQSVVLRVHPTVHAAYQKRAAQLPVSDQTLYDKLQCMELGVSAALVADSAQRLAPAIDALGVRAADWVRGYRTRILDGNHLSKSERRLQVLRSTWAAALPGKVLAVYEPATDLVTHVCLTPDGHAQERALFDDVLNLVQRRDQCSVFSVQFSVFSVQCSVFSVQCSVFSVQFSVFRVPCSVFSKTAHSSLNTEN
jgi:hypothetical protein